MTTKKTAFYGIAITILTAVLFLGSCKKKDKITVTECFKDEYNGAYTGSGVVGNDPAFTGTLTLTKKGCQEAEIRVGSIVENVSQLSESAGGGYNGKTATGASVSISLSNATSIGVSVGTTINFSGTK
jgi:hypothetical protein